MNFQFYMEKLQASKEFKAFIKENKESYFCSAFITIDKEGQDNQRHIDFYSPKDKKIFSFDINNEIKVVPLESVVEKKPEKIPEEVDFGLEDVESLVFEEMEKQNVKNKLQKIMISLQNSGEKTKTPMLICTVFVSMMGLLKINIELNAEGKEVKPKVVLFEKKSLFDMVRRVK